MDEELLKEKNTYSAQNIQVLEGLEDRKSTRLNSSH